MKTGSIYFAYPPERLLGCTVGVWRAELCRNCRPGWWEWINVDDTLNFEVYKKKEASFHHFIVESQGFDFLLICE